MKEISEEADCRDFIRHAFKISEIMKTNIDSYVHHYELTDSDDEMDDDMCLDLLSQASETLHSNK